MGVLACSRRGCENIMCDRLSHNYGYICNDCFNELVDLGVNASILLFMDTEKHCTHNDNEAASRAYFNEIFKDKNN